MTRLEFKKYIEEKLDRELFEEKAMKSIKERAGESDDEQKELSENQWSYVNILDTKSQTFLCCTSS